MKRLTGCAEPEFNIPSDFFREESRLGFTVTEMMKRAWAAQIKIFKMLEIFFEKYNIKYCVVSGTLLGAVRHKGYIPWDDDLDLIVRRKDYMVFLEHANELPDCLKVLSIYSSDTFYNFHAVVKNNGRCDDIYDKKRADDFFGFPFITGIDIFVADNIPSDIDKASLQKAAYTIGYSLVHKLVDFDERTKRGTLVSDAETEKFIEELDEFNSVLIRHWGRSKALNDDRPLLNELCRACDMIAMSAVNEKNSERIASYAWAPLQSSPVFGDSAEDYSERIELKFEYITVYAPSRYDRILINNYGTSYMEPRMVRGEHEYPFYGDQAKVLAFRLEYDELERSSKASAIALKKHKKIIFVTGIEALIINGRKKIEEVEKFLEKYAKEADTEIVWYCFGLTRKSMDILNVSIPDVLKEYCGLTDKYLKYENVIAGLDFNYLNVIEACDEYYGDDGILAELFKKTGKSMDF